MNCPIYPNLSDRIFLKYDDSICECSYCPICRNQAYRIFPKNDYSICECSNCHHRYTDINPSSEHIIKIYQDEYFKSGGAGYPDYLRSAKLLLAHGKRYSILLKKFTNPGTILDVGTAAGFILKGFLESGWQGIGLEPNLSMAEYGRTQLGLQIENGSLEEFSSTQQFDLVTMIQVLSHFYDIRTALLNAAEATKPGGFWLIETWNRKSWIARFLGKHWHEYSPPSVLNWFSPEGLKILAAQFGFSEVTRGHPTKGISGEHAKSIIENKIRGTPVGWILGCLNIIPNEIEIPYPTSDLFWALFKKDKKPDGSLSGDKNIKPRDLFMQ